jgi:hypothetical protein
VLAGEWIRTHVPPGGALSLPNLIPYPNPTVGPNADDVRRAYRTLGAQLLARNAAANDYRIRYLAAFGTPNAQWRPEPGEVVVTSAHPAVTTGFHATAAQLALLRQSGAEVLAEIRGLADPPDARIRFDPMEAVYVPIAGFRHVERPGPNLTIWKVPEAHGRSR